MKDDSQLIHAAPPYEIRKAKQFPIFYLVDTRDDRTVTQGSRGSVFSSLFYWQRGPKPPRPLEGAQG